MRRCVDRCGKKKCRRSDGRFFLLRRSRVCARVAQETKVKVSVNGLLCVRSSADPIESMTALKIGQRSERKFQSDVQ